jgi:hypothetical protein
METLMNERIKELAIESKLIAPEYNGFEHTRLSISQQKFAELIIKECIANCNDLESMRYISNHFGITIQGLE